MSGAFITLEGIEGVGKSTCLELVRERLTAAGHRTLVTREPGGTSLGESVREWILHGEHRDLSAQTEALLMFAARAHHLDEVIRPALAEGIWVICDRFTDATIAYQGGGRGADRGFLGTLKTMVHGSLDPHLTLLLDAPVEVGLARIEGRAPDHFEREDRGFFERVRKTYLELAASEPRRMKVVDARHDLAAVEAQLTRLIDGFVREFDASS